jgi:type IV pilus assembly protein PilE
VARNVRTLSVPRKPAAGRAFSLIELMVVLAVVGILTAVSFPVYRQHIIRGNREGAKTELVEIAAQQEKIYLNSDAYTSSVTAAYTGTSAGGLGRTTGRTANGKYTLSIVTAAQSYTVTATPVSGTVQASDGNLTVSSDGSRTWGTTTW